MNTTYRTVFAALIAAGCLSVSFAARADRERAWHGGDIRHFEGRDMARWHDGGWYFYPEPVYPYTDPYIPPVVVQQQAPPAVVIQQAPPAGPTPPSAQAPATPPQVWYYCEASKSYYPYIASCPGGWKQVPAAPADAAQR
jgi:hypothetical protein